MHRLLDRIERRGDLFTKDAFVFASRKGTGLERKTARAALKRAVIAAQLDSPHPTLHDRRHTHASMLIGLDFNVVEVQHRLGQKAQASPSTSTPMSRSSATHRRAKSETNLAACLPAAPTTCQSAKRPPRNTDGVDANNAADFLRAGAVAVGVVLPWMTLTKDLV